MIIPREFSKSKEQIDKLKAKAKKDAPKDKKDMADLKREVEMTVHTISPYEGLCEMAHEMSFNPPATIEEHLHCTALLRLRDVITFLMRTRSSVAFIPPGRAGGVGVGGRGLPEARPGGDRPRETDSGLDEGALRLRKKLHQ